MTEVAELAADVKQGQPVTEMIGRYVVAGAQLNVFQSRARVKTVDETIPDYEFYDRLRRCKAVGFTLSGLFCARIERILAAWVLGDGVAVTLHEGAATGTLPARRRDYTNGLLAEFIAGLLDAGQDEAGAALEVDAGQGAQLLALYRDSLGLGDQYVIMNVDGTLSIPSPDTVTIQRNMLDYRRWDAVIVVTKLNGWEITDEYRRLDRTVTYKEGGDVRAVQTYPNLLGVIPVVHIANMRSGNETNGHSIHEALRPLYDQYDDLIYKQLDGAKALGNPILTLAGLEDLNAVKTLNRSPDEEQYSDRNGNEQTRSQLDIDSTSVLLVGKGGSAGYTAPPVGFTEDTKTALKSLFLLLLDHTGIPESIWGGELGSARASADTQQGQFVNEVIGWQRDAGGWLVRLCKLWLMTKALTDPKILVGRLALEFAPVVQDGKEIRLKYVETARKEGLLTDETALGLMDLVKDPAAEVAAARKEAEERQAAMFPDGVDQFGGALNATMRDEQAIDAQNQDGGTK